MRAATKYFVFYQNASHMNTLVPFTAVNCWQSVVEEAAGVRDSTNTVHRCVAYTDLKSFHLMKSMSVHPSGTSTVINHWCVVFVFNGYSNGRYHKATN